jgi:hypothetical protein
MRLSFFLPAAVLISGPALTQATSPEQHEQDQWLMVMHEQCVWNDAGSCHELDQLAKHSGWRCPQGTAIILRQVVQLSGTSLTGAEPWQPPPPRQAAPAGYCE